MEKVKKIPRTALNSSAAVRSGNKWVLSAVAFAASFAAGLGKILGFPSYMCVAVSALSGDYVIPSFLGALSSFVIAGSFEGAIVQLCSILVIGALRGINPLGEHRDEPIYMSLTTSGTLMLFSSVMSVAVTSDFYITSMRMINSLLCGCVVFIARSIAVSRSRNGVYDLSGMNGIFAGIIYIMTVCSFSSLSALSLNFGRIVGVFALLQAVRKYRSFGGAVIGGLTTCGVLICEPDLARNTLLLATSGLVCGAFVPLGMLVTVLIFLVISLISLVAVGVNADTYKMFADLSVGSMLFIIVPVPAVKRFGKKVSGFKSALDIVGQTTSSRLAFAGETLGGIRHQLTMVTAAMDKKTSLHSVADDVKRCVCGECAFRQLCFEKNSGTQIALDRLGKMSDSGHGVTEKDVMGLLKCCTKPSLVSRAFCEFSSRLVEEKAENIRMREMRELLTEQLSSMEDILNDLSFRSSLVRSIDANLSAHIRDYFRSKGYFGAKACVYVDESLCRRADVFVGSDFHGDVVKITAEISSALDCDMALPNICTEQGITRISFAEIPVYQAQAVSFTASAGEEYSGDSFEMFDLNGNEKYILLSDGMGTGKRARLDSVFTVSLASKLICSGLSMTTAHRLINSMLRVKGWEESFATMDLMKIDLNGGSASVLKSGAVQSRLCRDGCVTAFGGQAFPAGILSDCVPDMTELKLFDGDIIVMTSDGADDDTADELSQIAADNPEEHLEDIVRLMGKYAMSKRQGKKADDLTIIAVKISMNNVR